jgi:hypothetical protein
VDFSATTPVGKNFLVPSGELFEFLDKGLVFVDFNNQTLANVSICSFARPRSKDLVDVLRGANAKLLSRQVVSVRNQLFLVDMIQVMTT